MLKKSYLLLCLTASVCVCGPCHAGKEFPEGMSESLTLSAPSPSPPSTAQTTSVGHFKLDLAGCRLTYEGAGKTGVVDFDIPAPCQFNRNAKGEVRVVRTGKSQTLLVESSSPADPTTHMSVKDCSTFIRGIIVTRQEIRISAQTQQVAKCLPTEWDEKMFHAFAARTQSAANMSR